MAAKIAVSSGNNGTSTEEAPKAKAGEVREELASQFDQIEYNLRAQMIRWLARKASQLENGPLTIAQILYRIRLAVEGEEDEEPLFRVSQNVLANTLCQDKYMEPARNESGTMTFFYTGPKRIPKA